MQDNAAQQLWYSILYLELFPYLAIRVFGIVFATNIVPVVQYWQPTQFQILVNLPKWYIQVFFFVKMVVEVLITLT